MSDFGLYVYYVTLRHLKFQTEVIDNEKNHASFNVFLYQNEIFLKKNRVFFNRTDKPTLN